MKVEMLLGGERCGFSVDKYKVLSVNARTGTSLLLLLLLIRYKHLPKEQNVVVL